MRVSCLLWVELLLLEPLRPLPLLLLPQPRQVLVAQLVLRCTASVEDRDGLVALYALVEVANTSMTGIHSVCELFVVGKYDKTIRNSPVAPSQI